jgi:NAD(P)-dependent dehydrogenase (short-subunit alcohol dehydrogenase family)
VRDLVAPESVARQGVEEFGSLDIVCANAGIASSGQALELDERNWQTMIDINLTGTWKTVKATAPLMVEGGRGGSVILTSSVAGLIAFPDISHHVAAKHGVTGLMRAFAIELAPFGIRVNSVHPASVDTPMVADQASWSLFLGGGKGRRGNRLRPGWRRRTHCRCRGSIRSMSPTRSCTSPRTRLATSRGRPP